MNMRGLSLRDLMSAADDDAASRDREDAAPVAPPPFAVKPMRTPTKASIGFILGHQSDDDDGNDNNNDVDDAWSNHKDVVMRDADDDDTLSEREDARVHNRQAPAGLNSTPRPQGSHATTTAADASARKTKKRKARICKEPGCQKYVVDHGLCIRHGGGKRCSVEDCNCRAQNRGLCWKHGGYTICKIEGCTKRAKSKGICWSHGGGTRCKDEGCTKIAVSHGKCWAHGGGKRCIVEGCKRPASERTDNCCADHYGGRGSEGMPTPDDWRHAAD